MATIQTTGHIFIDGNKILLLARIHTSKINGYVALKLRKSGKEGSHFTDEQYHLEENRDALNRLLNGEVINL